MDTLPISVACPTVTQFNAVTFIKNTTWFEYRFRHSVSSCNEASVIIVVQLVLPVISVVFWGSFSPRVCECWSFKFSSLGLFDASAPNPVIENYGFINCLSIICNELNSFYFPANKCFVLFYFSGWFSLLKYRAFVHILKCYLHSSRVFKLYRNCDQIT